MVASFLTCSHNKNTSLENATKLKVKPKCDPKTFQFFIFLQKIKILWQIYIFLFLHFEKNIDYLLYEV
jgi:hypothetical protein